MITIRQANDSDLDAIKAIADKNKNSIGFVMRAGLAHGIERKWLLVAYYNDEIAGFAHYRHRQDSQTTLYEICVHEQLRGQGIGKALMAGMIDDARRNGKACISLKTPIDLAANGFYSHLGFTLIKELPGRKRPLNLWQYRIGAQLWI